MSTSSIFSGSSRYGADFQQVVSRAVSIASLPLVQLNNSKISLTNKQAAYESITGKFSAVQTAIDNLANAAKSSFSGTTSDSSVATVSTGAGAAAGWYSIGIIQAGAASQYISATGSGVADPSRDNIAAGTSFTLTIDGETTAIEASASNLSSLALAINQAGKGVQASILNLGSPASPDYVLTLQGTAWKAQDIQLSDSGGTPLMSKLSDGQEAIYTVNGQPPAGIVTDSPGVIVAPGVSVNLQAKTGTAAISVARDTARLGNALSSLATAYNVAIAELNRHRGQNGGALQGDSQINTLAATLRNLINFGTGQAVNTLGLTFDKTGMLSVDSGRMSSQPDDAIAHFLGDGTSDGFLKNAGALLDSVQKVMLPSVQDTLRAAVQRSDEQIAATQNRIDLLEVNLNQRMAAADALVALLEQNVTYFTNMFTAQNTNAGLYK